MLITDKSSLRQYSTPTRSWQGIPGIERTAKGRLFVSFYSGGSGEMLGNYCVLVTSENDGYSWSEPVAVADFGGEHRCFDPCLWIDPLGRLWFAWAVQPDNEVWAAVCESPDSVELIWSEPRKIGDGVMLNKPIVTKRGKWLFPMAVWKHISASAPSLSSVYVTTDSGATFRRLGGADVPNRTYDENMLIELASGALLMLVRTTKGIGKSLSFDGGSKWAPCFGSELSGPDSRFNARRLASGDILMINHVDFTERNNLTAQLSSDELMSFTGSLLLDGRSSVSYPDSVQASDGYIYAVYDRDRYGAGEILMVKFREEDILAGRLVSAESRLAQPVSRLKA